MAPELVGGLHTTVSSLLLGGQGVDLLAGSHEAAVVLLLYLGADVVKSHEGRCSFQVIVNLDVCHQN